MTILVVCLHVIVCFVLIIVILLQAGRSQGLTGSTFGSGNVQSLFGTKAGSFLTKATSVCAILFLFTCLGLNMIETQRSKSLYQNAPVKAPLDIDQIKKALEKVKAAQKQASATTTETAGAAATAASTTVSQTAETKPAEK